MTSYRSKVDWWFYLVIAVFFALTMLMLYLVGYSIATYIIAGVTFLILLPMLVDTRYILMQDAIMIKCGLIMNFVVRYSDITSVRPTKSWLASAALSTDRIEIRWGKRSWGMIHVSPKKKVEFLQELTTGIKEAEQKKLQE